MLTQSETDQLLAMPKRFVAKNAIDFPAPGDKGVFEVESLDRREQFLVDINRGRIRISKCTYQERYRAVEVLVRVDVDGPPHENPDGEVIPCPHMHIYRESYGDKWAEPLPSGFADTTDLVQTFVDFLRFCRVTDVPEIHRGIV